MITQENDGSGAASTPYAGSRASGRTVPSTSPANERNNDLRVAIAGYGAIGQSLAASLKAGIPGIALTAIASRDAQRLRAALPQDSGLRVVPVAELRVRRAD